QHVTQGGLVAFPTETVYGLGADASQQSAVLKVFATKGRPLDHPLIVHLGDKNWVKDWAQSIPKAAWVLMEKFWPGPLTLVLPKQNWVPDWISAKEPNIALRMPEHPLALALLKNYGKALVGPSANRYGCISPTSAQAVHAEFPHAEIDLILDGGDCEIGIESTIVYVNENYIQILRPGMLSAEMLYEASQLKILNEDNTTLKAPGKCKKHYAPERPLKILSEIEIQHFLNLNSSQLLNKICILSLNPNFSSAQNNIILQTMPHSPKLYAKNLYKQLRAADAKNPDLILLESPPTDAPWQAIWNRILRANND
ncbi:MAG: L-threonylcarbamoyladenylate synthase, partial [Gammaproteobacteria bacterium]